MQYEDLDSDTKSIIDAMCQTTGKSKEQAILALVEVGMLAMIASVSKLRDIILPKIFECINNDAKMKETAEAYAGTWVM